MWYESAAPYMYGKNLQTVNDATWLQNLNMQTMRDVGVNNLHNPSRINALGS